MKKAAILLGLVFTICFSQAQGVLTTSLDKFLKATTGYELQIKQHKGQIELTLSGIDQLKEEYGLDFHSVAIRNDRADNGVNDRFQSCIWRQTEVVANGESIRSSFPVVETEHEAIVEVMVIFQNQEGDLLTINSQVKSDKNQSMDSLSRITLDIITADQKEYLYNFICEYQIP